jgi:hypothetical protein
VAVSAGQLVNAAFFKAMGGVVVFCFRFMSYCVGAPEVYFCVCLFEKISGFSNLCAMVGEGGQFFHFVVIGYFIVVM